MAEIYLQFQNYFDEVASFYNVARGYTDGRYILNNNGIKVAAKSEKRNLLITLVGLSTSEINAKVIWKSSSPLNVIAIVLSVVGGTLMVSLIIVAICIIRKRSHDAMRVSSELDVPS